MNPDLKILKSVGWLCVAAGGFLLGTSVGLTDRTIASACFYGVAVLAFAARAALSPAVQAPIENKGGGK